MSEKIIIKKIRTVKLQNTEVTFTYESEESKKPSTISAQFISSYESEIAQPRGVSTHYNGSYNFATGCVQHTLQGGKCGVHGAIFPLIEGEFVKIIESFNV